MATGVAYGPAVSADFANAEQEYAELLEADEWSLFERAIVWFQAQHTIPSPMVLSNATLTLQSLDKLAVADQLGWPSDFRAWGRFIDWIVTKAPIVPRSLLPKIIEIFNVWQNPLLNVVNARSEAILAQCNAWLLEAERGGDGTERAWVGPKAYTSDVVEMLRAIILRSARTGTFTDDAS